MDAAASGYLAPFVDPEHALDIRAGDAPAAGANFSFAEASNRIVVPVSLTFQLVTDANAANRTVRIEYGTGRATVWYREICGSVQAATTTALYSANAWRGAAEVDTNNFISMPLLPLPLLPGQSLQINVTNIQATDQLSAIVLALGLIPLGR